MDFSAKAKFYKDFLLQKVMPFWEANSIDREFGGYFTCLDKKGKVYDTDKFMWLQARQVWTLSMFCNRLEKRDSWLEAAAHGAKFITKHGMDGNGDWYFSLDRQGRPLIQAYNIFSDCFACMGLAQYSVVSGDAKSADIALRTYKNILRRKDNPKGKYTKAFPGTRPLKNFALPMILCNLALELEPVIGKEEVEKTIDIVLDEVLNVFFDKNRRLVFENVLPDGSHSDCFDGRLINPGHGIEAMWFIMDIGRRRGDKKLIDTAAEIVLDILKFGWDKEHEGILYFLDSEGRPPQQLEWDQKLWWVHLETLVALSMAYNLTGRKEFLDWFERIDKYSWARFADFEDGEWYGYLNRRGEILLPLKGGKWKGCFHLPRALFRCANELEAIAKK